MDVSYPSGFVASAEVFPWVVGVRQGVADLGDHHS